MLKGQTHLEKLYVAKKIILHAVRRKNGVILALQAKILDMEKIETGLQLAMKSLQKDIACESVVLLIIVQGRNEVLHI